VRKDRLGKLYDRFQPEERFRLTLEALARGDEGEADRLSESCPRRTYTMNDLAYGDKIRAGLQITMVVCLDLGPRLAKLQMLDALRVTGPYLRTVWKNEAYSAYFDGHRSGNLHAWRAAGMEADPPGWKDWEEAEKPDEEACDPAVEGDLENIGARVKETTALISERLDKLEREFLVEVRTVWEAFAGFCEEELGFGPETLFKAYFEPMLEQIEELKALMGKPDAPGPDPQRLSEYREAMSSAWTTFAGSHD
jgi:hypothetical protein